MNSRPISGRNSLKGHRHRLTWKFEDEIIKKAVDNAQCDIPEVMVNRRLDAILTSLTCSSAIRE